MPDRGRVDPPESRGALRLFVREEVLGEGRGLETRADPLLLPDLHGPAGQRRAAEELPQRDPKAVADEIESLTTTHPETSHFFIVDSVFNLPPEHAKDVCRELIARGNELPWTCYANPIGFDEELAGLMREAACVGMEIGSDSGCNEILAKLKKGFTVDEIRAIRETRE